MNGMKTLSTPCCSYDRSVELNLCHQGEFLLTEKAREEKIFTVQFALTRFFVLPDSALPSCKELMASIQSASLYCAQLPPSREEMYFYCIHLVRLMPA